MKKTFFLLLLLPLFLMAENTGHPQEFEFKPQYDVPLIPAKWSCFQCSLQPYRPYMHLFPSDITVTGLNFSFCTSQEKTKGLSMALYDSDRHSSGITLAVFNNTYFFTGLALAVVSWQTELHGVAASLINITDKRSSGCQLGLVNISQSDFQIGLINWNLNGWIRCAPFINFGANHRPRQEGITD